MFMRVHIEHTLNKAHHNQCVIKSASYTSI